VLDDTDLCKVLPNLFRFFTFSFPLLTDNLGNIRIVKARIAGDNGLLMVLPIKDKCYKGVSGCASPPKNKEHILCSVPIHTTSRERKDLRTKNRRLTVSWAGYLRFRLTETDVWGGFSRPVRSSASW
jgi:hypothetical protein